MDIRLSGPVQIRGDNGEVVRLHRRKERLALSVLVLAPSRVVAVDRLVDLIWGQARAIESPRARSARLVTALDLWRGPALADTAVGDVRDQLCPDLELSRAA